jgi:outer membrane protein TolC
MALAVVSALLAVAPASSAQDDPAEDPAAPAVDEEPPRKRSGGADLERCLALAERHHPDLMVQRAKVNQTRAQLQQARFAPFSQFQATGGVALAPTVRGSAVFSPNTDASLTSSLGVAWRANISGVLPLWTFGKITNLWEAAEANVKLSEADVEVQRDSVRFDVRQAYLGLQLARDGLYILRQAQRDIEKAIEQLEKRVADDDADPIDLLKLQTFSAELYAKKAEAERYERITKAGLRFYTGVSNLELADEPLVKAAHRLRGLERYLAAARVYRPEIHKARAGIAAREAQVRLSQSQMFPDIGLGLNFGISAAPEVADQINPYVNDRGNYLSYGAALVFQWNLDFVPGWYRVKFAEAQLQEVLALDRKALGGVAAQVEEAYAEALDWQKRLDAYTKAEGYARKWLVTVKQAIDIGTMEDKDLIDPAKAYAEHRYNALNATMEYNLALTKLARVTGWDAIAPGG